MQAAEQFSLGSLSFRATNFEVPEDLSLQKSTLGGVVDVPQTDGTPATRVSQTQGVVCDTIRFTAWFIGPNAEANAELLEAIQAAQNVVVFTRGARQYDVVVYKVDLKYHSANEIAYDVEIEPLQETSAGLPFTPVSSVTTVMSQVSVLNSLIYNAPAVPLAAPLNEFAQGVVGAIPDPSAITQSVSQATSVLSTVTSAISGAQGIVSGLAGLTDAASVSTYLYGQGLIGTMSSIARAIGPLVGAGANTILPSGMNAYELASVVTGNVNNFQAILDANNLTDPFNLGSAALFIPQVLLGASK